MRTSKIRAYSVPFALSLVMLLMRVANSQADSVEEFYRGKQVRFITAYSAGGLFDTATRIFARHIGKFIPGKPNVWVDNMTGAGGLIATNYLANSAPRDGSVLLNLDGALLRLQALGNPAAKFDARRFNWLPSPGPDIQVCWVGKQSSWQSITEAFSSSKELKVGGLAPGTFPSDNARALQAALGINLKIVDGFKGVTEIRLATESGEVDGSCSSYEGVVRSFPNELKAGDIRVIAQIGEKPWQGLENVPNAIDLAKSERSKWLLRVAVIGPNDINRLFTLPPGVPADRVAAMRKAFDATFADPEFQAEIEKARVVLRRIPIERIEEVSLLWLDMPTADKKELQKILKIN
ncbi:MAG: Bug family tripartite tricarboxylate transporter substrate binding protein [Candidatus Binatia bacterium]